MDYAEHVDAVVAETQTLAAAFRKGEPEARVPSCPDWAVADLAEHVGGFTGFWAHVLCEGTGRPKPPFPELRPGASLGDWYDEVAAHLVAELRATPPDTTVWTWADDKSARFVGRRCAHELSVHRFDAQLAIDAPQPIDPAVAADGIDEIIYMVDAASDRAGRGEGETLHLHGTDRDDEWLFTLDPHGLHAERRHAKADLALRGAVSDLELMLYQRPTIGDVERLGDEDVLAVWKRVFTFG
jgi:uncharacterized protein (TIGR03083 family)